MAQTIYGIWLIAMVAVFAWFVCEYGMPTDGLERYELERQMNK